MPRSDSSFIEDDLCSSDGDYVPSNEEVPAEPKKIRRAKKKKRRASKKRKDSSSESSFIEDDLGSSDGEGDYVPSDEEVQKPKRTKKKKRRASKKKRESTRSNDYDTARKQKTSPRKRPQNSTGSATKRSPWLKRPRATPTLKATVALSKADPEASDSVSEELRDSSNSEEDSPIHWSQKKKPSSRERRTSSEANRTSGKASDSTSEELKDSSSPEEEDIPIRQRPTEKKPKDGRTPLEANRASGEALDSASAELKDTASSEEDIPIHWSQKKKPRERRTSSEADRSSGEASDSASAALKDSSSSEEDTSLPGKKCSDTGAAKMPPEASCNSGDELDSASDLDTPTRKRLHKKKKTSSSRGRMQEEASEELKELLKDQDWMSRPEPKKKPLDDGPEAGDGDDQSEEYFPPICPFCRICRPPQSMDLKYSYKDEAFFTCSGRGDFMWPKETKKYLPDGPKCHCGRPSYPIKDNESGESKWVCAKTGGMPCAFEQSLEDFSEAVRPETGEASESKEVDTQYLVGAETLRKLQHLFHLTHKESKRIRSNGPEPNGYYDYLQVERAWRIDPPAESVADFEDFRKSQAATQPIHALRPEYTVAVQSFEQDEHEEFEPLHSEANELLLVHGTKPEVVASILERVLILGWRIAVSLEEALILQSILQK